MDGNGRREAGLFLWVMFVLWIGKSSIAARMTCARQNFWSGPGAKRISQLGREKRKKMAQCNDCTNEALYTVLITKQDQSQEVKQLCDEHRRSREIEAKDHGLRFQYIQGGQVI